MFVVASTVLTIYIFTERLYVLDVINNAKRVMETLEDNTSIIQEDMSMTSSVISGMYISSSPSGDNGP